MEIPVPIENYLEELVNRWERVQSKYKGDDPITVEEWAQFCSDFNKNLQAKNTVFIKDMRESELRLMARSGSEALGYIFQCWQMQYRMITNEAGRLIKTARFKRDSATYIDVLLRAKKSIKRYTEAVADYIKSKENNHGGDIQESEGDRDSIGEAEAGS